MKKLTIFVVVVLLLAMTAVPAFAHPDASDDGLTTARSEDAAGTNPTDGNAGGNDGGAIPAGNPLCVGHGAPGSH